MQRRRRRVKRSKKGLIAIMLACITLLATGMWAWQSFQSLTATNILKSKGAYNAELHDLFNDVEQISNSADLKAGGAAPAAVTLDDWEVNEDTEKRIWMQNPADTDGAVFVRLQLTEVITGGDAPYNLNEIFKGLDNTGVAEPSLVDWTLGSAIQDLAGWDGTSFGDFWLMDQDTGYAYWMNPLFPGQTTDDFLSSIELLIANEEELTYVINVAGDAISATAASDRDLWGHTSANDTKLDDVFALYQDLVDPTRVMFDTTTPAFTAAFPDAQIQQYLTDIVDGDGDDEITLAELRDATDLTYVTGGAANTLPGYPTNLTGIENLPYLEKIEITGGGASGITGAVDLSKNGKLIDVALNNNQIATVNAKNTTIENLALNNNLITAVDLAANKNSLEKLIVNNNNLTALDLTQAGNLTDLKLNSNAITSLDISKTQIADPIVAGNYANNGMTSITINATQDVTTFTDALKASSGNALNAAGAIIVE